jgi:hypothetical protein
MRIGFIEFIDTVASLHNIVAPLELRKLHYSRLILR